MPPDVALIIWLVLLLALLAFDPAKEPKTSTALWIPVIWLSIFGSRSPATWLGIGTAGGYAQSLEEGNPLNRAIFLLLITVAIVILISRSFQWGDFVTRNFSLIVFLVFALLSVTWSAFPLDTFRKWYRDLGQYLAVLLVLTDPHPFEAIRTVLRRVCYLLIPASVLLIKYFTHMGVVYDSFSGLPSYSGVTEGKNLLGLLCEIALVFFIWDTVVRWPDRKDRKTKRILWINYSFIVMSLWLLRLAQTVTSDICLLLACILIFLAHSKFGRRHSLLLKSFAPSAFISYVVFAFGFGMASKLSEDVGKNATMGDRVRMWKILITAHINPLLGAGYNSFWLGSRTAWFWSRMGSDLVAEAHNGYVGLYLDLGFIGLFLFAVFLIRTYRRTCKRLTPLTSLGSLSLALWTTLLFFNVTEMAFEYGFLWAVFMLVALEAPERIRNRGNRPANLGMDAWEGPPEMPIEVSG